MKCPTHHLGCRSGWHRQRIWVTEASLSSRPIRKLVVIHQDPIPSAAWLVQRMTCFHPFWIHPPPHLYSCCMFRQEQLYSDGESRMWKLVISLFPISNITDEHGGMSPLIWCSWGFSAITGFLLYPRFSFFSFSLGLYRRNSPTDW